MKNKMIEYALALKSDLQYHLENDEEQSISEQDISTLKWLIDQARKAEFYEAALKNIGEVIPENAARHASFAIYEGEQIYERR
ncbi:hypothetical protein [Niallia taxi]|uniref:hypothetical protein n=1 Tax=Niallia taxi TaxID=2499688 RepID=UPI0030096883